MNIISTDYNNLIRNSKKIYEQNFIWNKNLIIYWGLRKIFSFITLYYIVTDIKCVKMQLNVLSTRDRHVSKTSQSSVSQWKLIFKTKIIYLLNAYTMS